TGSLTRAIVIASISAALLLVGSLAIADRTRVHEGAVVGEMPGDTRTGIRWQPWLDSAALAGALGVIVTAIGRGVTASHSTWSGDAWLGAALLVLIVAGTGQVNSARANAGSLRAGSSQALAIIPLTAVIAAEIGRLSTPQLDV